MYVNTTTAVVEF